MRGKIALFIVLTAGLSWAAKAQTGTVRGNVISNEDGMPMIGTNVYLAGTTIGTITDLDGNFSLNNVPAGKQKIVASFISFVPDTIEVQVKEGEVSVVNFNLKTESIMMEAVVVEAKQTKNNNNYIVLMQQKAASVIDGISSEQFKNAGDRNVAAAVKRVTGVSVEGGKYVYVRGLSDRYSKTLLNNAEIPGLDPNRNSVQMDLFPTNLVENITVVKTFTPDLPADFTGGLVNIQTKDFPETKTSQFSVSYSYNTQASLNNNFLSSNKGKYDWLGFDDGTRALPDKASKYIPTLFEDNERLSTITQSFNKNFEPQTQRSFLNQSYAYSFGNQTMIFGKPLGFITALSYRKGYNYYTNGVTGRYSLTGNLEKTQNLNEELILNDTRGEENVIWGFLTNASYKISSNHKIGIMLMHNQNGNNQSRYQFGEIPGDQLGLYFETRTIQYTQRGLSTAQITGEHYLENLKKLKIEWISSASLSSQNQPDIRFFANDYILNQIQGTEVDTIYNLQPALYNVPARYFRDMKEQNLDNKINFQLPITIIDGKNSYIKFGLSNTYKHRIFKEKRYDYRFQGIAYNGNIFDFLADENMQVGNPDGYIYIQDATEKRNSYEGRQNIAAAYLMTDAYITKRLRAIAGARMEKTNILLESKDRSLPKGKLDNLDILPSVNMAYELTPKMKLRTAYTRTLARPTFRELAPFGSFNFIGDFLIVGNDSLKRTLIDNFDIRWEFYPNTGEIISISGFYKIFHNPIERAFNPVAAMPELNYRNVEKALVYGAEIEVKKSMGMIAPALQNLFIGANYSYIYSQVSISPDELQAIRATNPNHPDTREMFGQSPYVFNTFVNYKNDSLKLNATLAYNVSGPRIVVVMVGGTPNVYEQPFGQLNFSVSKQLGEKFKVKFSANNLLNPQYKQTQEFKGQEYIFQSYKKGRTFGISLTYKIH